MEPGTCGKASLDERLQAREDERLARIDLRQREKEVMDHPEETTQHFDTVFAADKLGMLPHRMRGRYLPFAHPLPLCLRPSTCRTRTMLFWPAVTPCPAIPPVCTLAAIESLLVAAAAQPKNAASLGAYFDGIVAATKQLQQLVNDSTRFLSSYDIRSSQKVPSHRLSAIRDPCRPNSLPAGPPSLLFTRWLTPLSRPSAGGHS